MLFNRLNGILAAGAILATTAVPATFVASDASFAATFDSFATTVDTDTALLPTAPAWAGDDSDADAVTAVTRAALATESAGADEAELDAELECMAKVVMHEAGNQPRAGKLAVAQLIVNRMESGRFADTICGVVNQPRQFFSTSAYNPRRDTAGWASAVDVAREARRGQTADVVPGAMFFRAAYAAPTGFFRTRTRVAAVGDHVFYR